MGFAQVSDIIDSFEKGNEAKRGPPTSLFLSQFEQKVQK